MLQRTYRAKNEFELYGDLVKEICGSEFPNNAVRALCFKREAHDSWTLLETLDTIVEKICGDFVGKHRPNNFLVVLDSRKPLFEVCFQGKELFLFGKFDGQCLSVAEFEDKNPNEAFKLFEKRELRESAAFLKKVFKGDQSS
jgi:hypothetical protein